MTNASTAGAAPGARESLPLLALVAALLFLPGIGARDLWAPDEPRYAEVAREMLMSGDWLVPRDNNRVYTDKPPLLFWMIALASLPAGEVGEVSARLPLVLCGMGTVLLTAALGRLWFGPLRGFAAGLLLATSYRGFVSAQWVQTDGPLAFFTTLAILGLARVLERGERSGWTDRLLVYGGVAGALLAKGPVGLAIPALVAAGWAVVDRRPGFVRGLRPWLLAAAILPLVAWGMAAGAASGGEYSLPAALRHHVLERFAEGLHHPRHPFYFLILFPLEFLPWTFFLMAWAVPPQPLEGPARAGRRQALLWLALPFVLFSLSAEKRAVYMLPLMPAAALLVAGAWPQGGWPVPGAAGRARALAPFVAFAALMIAALGVPLAARRHLPAGAAGLGVAVAIASAVSLVALRAAARGRGRAALVLAGAAAGALLLGVAVFAAPALNPLKSARPFCEQIAGRLAPSDRLGMYRFYRSAYVLYTGRFVEVIGDPAGLESFLGEGNAYCIVQAEDYDRLPDPLRRRYPPLESASIGHRRVLVIAGPRSP